jgi:hypothetical protein
MCLLLIALWVRSYSQWDQFYNPISNKTLIIVESASGRIILDWTIASPGARWRWHLTRNLQGEYWRGALKDLQTDNRHQGIGGFGYYGNPWHTIYRLPYWFLVALFAALAALPWLKRVKRFSLRTLLVVTTIVAILLGLVTYLINRGGEIGGQGPGVRFQRPGVGNGTADGRR